MVSEHVVLPCIIEEVFIVHYPVQDLTGGFGDFQARLRYKIWPARKAAQ